MTDFDELIAERLTALGPAWRIRHAVPSPELDIRHLVIGPGGVFAVTIEYHPRKARFQSRRAARLLTVAAGCPVEVTTLTVLAGTAREIGDYPSDVVVCNAQELPGLLKNRPPVLSPVTIGAIHGAARRRETWRPAA